MSSDTLVADAIYHVYSFLSQLFSTKIWGRRATENRKVSLYSPNVCSSWAVAECKRARAVPTLS